MAETGKPDSGKVQVKIITDPEVSAAAPAETAVADEQIEEQPVEAAEEQVEQQEQPAEEPAEEQAPEEQPAAEPAEEEQPPEEEQPAEKEEEPAAQAQLPQEVEQQLRDFQDVADDINSSPELTLAYLRQRKAKGKPLNQAQQQTLQVLEQRLETPAAAATTTDPGDGFPKTKAELNVAVKKLQDQGKDAEALELIADFKLRPLQQELENERKANRERTEREQYEAAKLEAHTAVRGQFKEAATAYPELFVQDDNHPAGYRVKDKAVLETMQKLSKGLGPAEVPVIDILETSLVRLGRHQNVKPRKATPAKKPAAKPAAKSVAPRPGGVQKPPEPGMVRVGIITSGGNGRG